MKQQTFMPKPRLALHVGITGHRSNKLGPEALPAVERALRALFATLGEAIDEIARETRDTIYSSAAPLIGIVSGLADGADRSAIAAALQGWRLEAVLPMPRAEYARDFLGSATTSDSHSEFEALLERADSVTELALLPAVDVRESAGRALHYRALGVFLVRQVDVLVAVWDGLPAKGPGGTAEVILRAFDEGRPVLWIDPKDTSTPRFLFAVDAVAHVQHRWRILDGSVVASLLRDLLMPPAAPQPAHDGHSGDDGRASIAEDHAAAIEPPAPLPAYFGLPWPEPMRLAFAYNLLRRLAGAGRWAWPVAYPSFEALAKSWDGFFNAADGAAADFNRRVRSILLPRSIWADALAWYYGHLYRSAYVSIFMLAGMSVPIGLCYLLFLDFPSVLDIKAGFVMLELLIISTVVTIVRRGVRNQWHAVWLETREMSEILRLGRSLAFVGAARDFVAAPQAGAPEAVSFWYARATFRELGPPVGLLDESYLRDVLEATLTTEIEEQRAYHAANAGNLSKIHHMLHHKGDACFIATIGFLLLYLAAWVLDHLLPATAAETLRVGTESRGLFHEFLEYYLEPIVSIAAAGLPALGAALSGIRAQGDFQGFAQRSETTRGELEEIDREVASLLAAPEPIGLEAASEVLLAATRVMASDVSAWQQLYVSKRLSLPA